MKYLKDVQRHLKGHNLTALMLIKFCECLIALKSDFESRKKKGFLKKEKA